jgi:hypothetical protein
MAITMSDNNDQQSDLLDDTDPERYSIDDDDEEEDYNQLEGKGMGLKIAK